MRLKIQKHLHWVILLSGFLILILIGIIFVVGIFSPSGHDYTDILPKTERTEQEKEQKKGTYYVYGGAHGLPLHNEPSQYSKVLSVIPNKTPIKIISKATRGYYKIYYKQLEGYVQDQYLLTSNQKVSDKLKKKLRNAYPLYYVVNCNEFANLYSKKKTSSKVLAEVSFQYRVRVLEKKKGYYRVAYKNKIGYIAEENLSQFKQQ